MAEGDIFGFQSKVGTHSFVDPEEGIIIGEGNDQVSLVQQWSVQYNATVTPIYECGTSTVYFSAKHTSGTFTCNRVFVDDFSMINSIFGTVCSPKQVLINSKSGLCNDSQTEVVNLCLGIKGSVLQSVSFSGNSQQVHIGEDLTATFVGLEIMNK
jgi:hypothetical protein